MVSKRFELHEKKKKGGQYELDVAAGVGAEYYRGAVVTSSTGRSQ